MSPLKEHVSGRLRLALLVLSCGVGAVMLIVCANLSNLLLARMAARQKEIAIRTALGAGRWRLVMQMLTEGLTLSLCGAVLGVVIAVAGTAALARLDTMSIPLLRASGWMARRWVHACGGNFDRRDFRSRAGVPDSGRQDARGFEGFGPRVHRRKTDGWIRSALVVSEIAFACVLLVGAGLLMRSFVRVLDVNLGFQPERAMSVRVDPDSQIPHGAQQNTYFDEVLRLAREVPGVQSAGLTDALPLGRNRGWGAAAKGVVYRTGEYPNAFVRIVTRRICASDGHSIARRPRFVGARYARDRACDRGQRNHGEGAVARQDALGKLMAAGEERRVVGIVGRCPASRAGRRAGNEMYIPIRQCQDWARSTWWFGLRCRPSRWRSAFARR